MTEELLNRIGIILFVSSVLVIISSAASRDRPSGIRQARNARAVRQLIADATGQTLRIDWMRYRGAPKHHIVGLANGTGWRHVGDEIDGRSWFLVFDRNPHAAVTSARDNEPHKRLTAELASATPDAKGRYVLDVSQYDRLSTDAIKQAVTASGWTTVRSGVGDELILARPGTTVTEFEHGPFLDGESPATLRDNSDVLARAREIERVKGFDPLSEYELNRARERHEYWWKPFNRNGRRGFLLGFLGLFLLAVTLSGDILAAYRELRVLDRQQPSTRA